MHVNLNRKLVAVAVAALAVTGGGAAIAASKLGSPKEESQAVINDAAQQLGVQPSALSDALKKALENRVDAAVAAGTITKAQGDEMKSRIESGNFPLFFGGGGGPGFPVLAGTTLGGVAPVLSELGLLPDDQRPCNSLRHGGCSAVRRGGASPPVVQSTGLDLEPDATVVTQPSRPAS